MKRICVLFMLITFMFCMFGCADAPSAPPASEGLTVRVCVMDDQEKVIIEETALTYTDGITAFDALMSVAAGQNVPVVHSSGYVTSIGNLAAGDKGDMSGWLFFVNGESPTVGASDYILAPDDVVLWQYTA